MQLPNQPIEWQQRKYVSATSGDVYVNNQNRGEKMYPGDFNYGMIVGARRSSLSISKAADLGFSDTNSL